MSRSWIFGVVALALGATTDAAAENSIVGTWKLVSAQSRTAKGEVNAAVFGAKPSGYLTYTADGRVMAIIADEGRKALSGDRISSPVEERAQAFSTVNAYAGTYTVTGDKVVHHVEVASIQNWVNTDQPRTVVFEGSDRLILRTQPLPRGGVQVTVELTWQRWQPVVQAKRD